MINKIKYYCQKILPLVYDDSLSYYEVLCKITKVVNKITEVVNEHSDRIKSIITDLGSLNNNVVTIAHDLSTVDTSVNKIIPNYWVTISNEPYIGIPDKTSYIKYIAGFDTAGLYEVTVRIIVENNTKPSMKSFEYYICPGNRPTEQTFDDSKIVRRIVTWNEQRTGNFGDTVTFLFNLSREVLATSESGRVNLFLDAFSYALEEGDSNIPLNVTSYCSRLLKY